jgi:hypothetical protein
MDHRQRREPGPARLTTEQRAMLDDLPPQARHHWSEFFHRNWATGHLAAEKLDDLVDQIIDKVTGTGATDFLMSLAMMAESLRAFARGDYGTANELGSTSATYHERAGQCVILPDLDQRDV